MKIRRFRAGSVSEALALVKEELGEEAVILKTERRRVQTEDGGRRMVWEVAAAIDRDGPHPAPHPAAATPGPGQGRTHLMGGEGGAVGDAPWDLLGWEPAASPLALFQRVVSTLGIPPSLHLELASRLCGPGAWDHRRMVGRLIHLAGSGLRLAPEATSGGVWAFVGPSGAGKTTVLAKVAARLKMELGRQGLLVAMDRYKLGGEEQLRGYAKLLGLPVVRARNPRELAEIIALNGEMDYIFVDTAGRATGDLSHRRGLEALFKGVPGLRAQLVVEATAKAGDLQRWLDAYGFAPVEGIIFTKIDETGDLGNLWVPLIKRGLALSYLSNGPRIPHDLLRPTKEELLRLLFSPLLEERRGAVGAAAQERPRAQEGRWT